MQKINLYLPEFRPKREVMSALNSVAALVLVFTVCTYIHISTVADLGRMKVIVEDLEAESKALNERMAVLKKTPRGEGRGRIERKINMARKAIENRNKITEVMTGKSLGNDSGFSSYMKALSEFSVDGIFLQHFSITHGGQYARFRGISKKPELVPLYISQLRKDSVFNTTKFGYLTMNSFGQNVEFSLTGAGAMDADTLIKYTQSQPQ